MPKNNAPAPTIPDHFEMDILKKEAEFVGTHDHKPIVVVVDQKEKKASKSKHCRKCLWPCSLFLAKAILLILGYLGYRQWIAGEIPAVKDFTKMITARTKAPPVTPAGTKAPFEQLCPDRWAFFNQTNSCFKYIKQRSTWKAAEEFCITKGAHMVSIHSEEENNFVKGMSEIVGVDDQRLSIWLGGYSPNKDNVFVWTDGTPWNFTWFHPQEPNMIGRENCIEVFRCGGYMDICWNNIECEWYRTGFVCKKNAHTS
uniref:C-type lectin domain-containing protein n=1 Tax=Steinernema glaseri TaxID=37863 RepID=A0A1I7YDX9_9BILA